MEKQYQHGGDRYRNSIQMDFSININPLGIHPAIRERLLQSCEQSIYYPDAQAQALYQSLSLALSVDSSRILCGNGASELLTALVHTLYQRDSALEILLPVPSFSGYQHAAGACDCPIHYFPLEEEYGFTLNSKVTRDIISFLQKNPLKSRILFLTNPNNPSGGYLSSDHLEELLSFSLSHKVTLVLDECFMELSEDPSRHSFLSRLDDYPNLVLLRAFTKSFAIPGVRLGYLLSSDTSLLTDIARHLPEWNLSVFAQQAGVEALRHLDSLEDARTLIRQEKKYLVSELEAMGFVVYPSATTFLLFYSDHNIKNSLYEGLLQKGILIRDCSNYQGLGDGYYRIAVRSHEENKQLVSEIGKLLDLSDPERASL